MPAPPQPFGFVPPTFEGSISNYTPSLRDSAAYWLAQNWFGDDREGVQKARRLTDVGEFTPFGLATMADDVTRATGRGDYLGAGTALAMAGMPGPTPKGIKAYHGSPHSFDKFSLDKIGTGEGAQAYGHGLYFAENERVAKEYRDNLTKMRVSSADRILKQYGGNVDEAIVGIRNEIDRLKNLPNAGNDAAKRDRFIALNEEHLAELNAYKNQGSMSKGSMYEVQINADPEQFLDWDKPLSEQPESVRAAIDTHLKSLPSGSDSIEASGAVPALQNSANLTGQQAYELALSQRTKPRRQTYPEITDSLRQAGIPGIKYLDQGSRGKGDGSRNYVVFDDSLIEILRKYGIALPFVGGALASAPFGLAPQQEQQ